MKVGELAKQTGISVRTLHHYDEIGLLPPSNTTEAGHRDYSAGDISRLQSILSLRQLGLSLEEVRQCLASPKGSPSEIIELHIKRVFEQIDVLKNLASRLEAVQSRMQKSSEKETPGSIDEVIQVIKEVVMFEKYFPRSQMDELKVRETQLGPEKIKAVQDEWPELIAQVKAAMDQGLLPSDPSVQALAKRWQELVKLFSGGNPKTEASVKTMYAQEPGVGASHGLNKELFAFIAEASRLKM